MTNRFFALFIGLVYVALGILGFIPGLIRMPWNMTVVRNTDIEPATGLLFGCLPVTAATNVLHLLIGGVGVAAFVVGFTASLRYAQGMAILMTLLALNGLMPLGLNTYWGFMPLSGGTLAVHLITAPMAFYFGYVYLFDSREVPGIA